MQFGKQIAIAAIAGAFPLMSFSDSAYAIPACETSGNLVQNCGFENTSGGVSTLNPWRITPGTGSNVGTFANSGNLAVSFGGIGNGVSQGSLSQTIDTTPSHDYMVSFSIRLHGTDLDTSFLNISFGDFTFEGSLRDYDLDLTNTGFQQRSIVFGVLDTDSVDLTFTGANTQSVIIFGPVQTAEDLPPFFEIDDVSVVDLSPLPDPQPTPVPEPATLALVGIGLAGLGVMRRRRPS